LSNTNSDFNQFEEMKMNLIKEIGDDLFKAVFKIIDEMIPNDSIVYDHEKNIKVNYQALLSSKY